MDDETMVHRTRRELDDRLPDIEASPRQVGRVAMIVSRPGVDERVVQDVGAFTVDGGLVGDTWVERGSRQTPDGSAHPDMQVALINARLLDAVAGSRERWPQAGDQLVVDLDLSVDNLPVGQLLQAGTARFVVTDAPHTGCRKFAGRFGKDALAFTADPTLRHLRLRGMYVRVVRSGTVRVGDEIAKVD